MTYADEERNAFAVSIEMHCDDCYAVTNRGETDHEDDCSVHKAYADPFDGPEYAVATLLGIGTEYTVRTDDGSRFAVYVATGPAVLLLRDAFASFVDAVTYAATRIAFEIAENA